MERRLNFLWYILHEDEESLVNMFLKAQLNSPVHGDWGQSCFRDLEELMIPLTICEIERMPEQKFRRIVKEKTELKAVEYLNDLKANHSKVMDLNHQNLAMQPYLEPNEMSVQETRVQIHVRS